MHLSIAYYITGHGLGHATRSVGIIQYLLHLGHSVSIITSLERRFFTQNLVTNSSSSSDGESLQYFKRTLDTGAFQTDPITVDPLKTLDAYFRTIHLKREELIQNELQFLKEGRFDVIVTDATTLICRIASMANIPCLIVSNFTWDFIYLQMLRDISKDLSQETLLQYEEMIAMCVQDCSQASLLIRLPAATPLSPAFHSSLSSPFLCSLFEAPMVCRLAKTPSRDVRNQLNLSADRKVLILAFGGHTNAKPLELKDGFLPENWICLAFGVSEDEVRGTSKFRALPFDVYMPDFIAMADVVMGKIGYGTVTECLAHGTPLIYIPRSHWPEEQYVEEYLLSYQAGVKLSAEDFYAGRWKEAVLTAAQKAETCWNVASLNAGSAIQIVGDEIVDYTVEYGRC